PPQLFLLSRRPHPPSTLFPYTTLFRSLADESDRERVTAELRSSGGRLAGEPPAGLQSEGAALWRALAATDYDIAFERLHELPGSDRKSTRLNSSHLVISYAVFCLKKKN